MTDFDQYLRQLVTDPNWLLHRYDETNDHFQFLTVPRSLHRECTFLTAEHLPEDAPAVTLRRSDTQRVVAQPAPVHFIFHSAYCCSTMLARALDIQSHSMGLKEPVILNDLVGWKRRGGDGRQIAQVLDQSMNWLAKPFERGESIVVKPSNIVNALADAMLAMRPNARALLLYAPLETFVRSIAKKNLWGRLWVRTLLIGQIKDQMIAPFGMTSDDILQLSDLQVAAIGWLAQQALFGALIDKYGPARVRSLNSENLLANQPASMKALCELFALNLSPAELDTVLAGPAFKRHSKLDMEFDASARESEHANAAELHADEIAKVCEWARVTAKRMNIPLDLPAPLT